MEVMWSIELATSIEPVQEQTHGELVQVLERCLLVSGVLREKLLEVRALLLELSRVDVEGFLVLAHVDWCQS